ncbi:glutathione synthetase [Neisseria sp. ZJ106]|uniref:Glutathione synthetase n=1 Tax=Neisseria lisongii TaxID=2912188 RepID=A0ABY7RKQ5_9NEIS|nr:glutathione synthetase [Neisseria lisongii]MCF7521708.1 glutathione synthetase [Neisseria lisongii]WCL72209.1 glutathione synthetase [Neisseria lisongii]
MLTITTCCQYPEPPATLIAVQQRLQALGIDTAFDTWQNRPQSPYLLPLCAWDYSEQPEAFRHWLYAAQAAGSRFANAPDLMMWNSDKRYLCDLAAQGVDVIPSLYLEHADRENLARIMRQNAWQQAVIKPAVGQSGKQVQKISPAHMPADCSAYRNGMMIQPYIAETAGGGEICMVFFQGQYSHAVRRQPPQGEWRANSAYGVAILPYQPAEHIIAAAQAVVQKLPELPLYARVDGTLIGQNLLLNELELIEPSLYLDQAAGAVERFVQAVAEWVAR